MYKARQDIIISFRLHQVYINFLTKPYIFPHPFLTFSPNHILYIYVIITIYQVVNRTIPNVGNAVLGIRSIDSCVSHTHLSITPFDHS